MKIIMGNNNIAMVYYAPYLPPEGVPYLEIDQLPDGDGVLKTDLVTVWREKVYPVPTFVSNELLSAQIQSISDRQEFIEDCIAEMAMQVYSEIPGE